ncbi:uncharacterized protein ACLA_053280 [Aspergillus clavatus NRRL 1]|uniref:Uncharacterized protein n=1 Tax=Aspergillus clavatus (strain ATCC 1007 / CBS 513.65 / DSM 816 / NCTC 3887 / NRRL 1 / QM 1276 / 107) TaxID=344612 RepID=A1CIZ9_ASPCL|nr:uncharacterized protein ACLA_053280 [Aspergillus clavatus NRRL 1]EAW10854.1 hypothetical protein ACLA_053280 [Aspergillus clavatus NRRL 1]
MLPGLHIGGFDLNSHRDFQLEIILHLSSKMLGWIKKLLGISLISSQYQPGSLSTEEMWTGGSGMPQGNGSGGGGGGKGGERPILDNESTSALLEVMLKQNDLGYFNEANGGAASVKQTLHDIHEKLSEIM